MNQLFYNIAGGTVHKILKIRREKKNNNIRSDCSGGKRNIKQNSNWFYFNFSVESSSFLFDSFKTEKLKLTFKVETDQQFVICLV